jgi:hypothetical protein
MAPLTAAMWAVVLACSVAPLVVTQAIMAVAGRRHASRGDGTLLAVAAVSPSAPLISLAIPGRPATIDICRCASEI